MYISKDSALYNKLGLYRYQYYYISISTDITSISIGQLQGLQYTDISFKLYVLLKVVLLSTIKGK